MTAERYISRQMRGVEGWLHPLTAQVIAALGEHQTVIGVSGAVGEIGVHHGKLWLVLDHVATPNEARFAIDVFESQEINADSFGLGDLKIFQENRKRFGRTEPVEIITSSSLDVTPDDLLARVGPVRLFSVDGGHTAECTLNDLRLADSVLCDNGIVALDDVFNEHWPGVMTGFAQYMLGSGRLVPICITPGKVILARSGSFGDFIAKNFMAEIFKTHDFFGREVPVLTRHAAFAHRVKSWVSGTPIEAVARKVYQNFVR